MDTSSLSKAHPDFDPDVDARVNLEIQDRLGRLEPQVIATALAEPQSVDMSPHLRYIRCQGGAGCWGYSALAAWDIMNEMACAYSPNLSMRLWMALHRRRDLGWENSGIRSPDGRFHAIDGIPEKGFLQSFGCTTEGTERTLHARPAHWGDVGWSREGINEADNYRLASDPQPITISSASFVAALAAGKPFRLLVGAHWVAVVGYDKGTAKFKYVNSCGDQWGNGGFGEFSFAGVDQTPPVADGWTAGRIHAAQVFDIVVPRPVPAARVSFSHTCRANVSLAIGIEDSPHPQTEVWPQDWREDTCGSQAANLTLTVRLPAELVWPPAPGSRVQLDVLDTGQYPGNGGQLVGFEAAFGGVVMPCASVPVAIQPGQQTRVTIP